MIKDKLFLYMTWLWTCAALSGCDSEARKLKEAKALAESPQTQERVKALVRKSTGDLVFVEGGGFWLGDFGPLMNDKAKANDIPPGPDAKPGDNLPFTIDEDNKPAKWVLLDGYSMQKYKVTYDDFDVYVAANALPAHPPEGDETMQRVWRKSRTSGDVPAGVTWHQAKSYCQWLAKVSGFPFDLPTEAQWEYAASARTNSYRHPYPTRTGLLIKNVTHPSFEKKKELIGSGDLYPIGRFEPSQLGFFDLIGNGYDWVNDWYSPDAYAAGATKNPSGPKDGVDKVIRGWPPEESLTSGFPHLSRRHAPPQGKNNPEGGTYAPTDISFRCVVNHSHPIKYFEKK